MSDTRSRVGEMFKDIAEVLEGLPTSTAALDTLVQQVRERAVELERKIADERLEIERLRNSLLRSLEEARQLQEQAGQEVRSEVLSQVLRRAEEERDRINDGFDSLNDEIDRRVASLNEEVKLALLVSRRSDDDVRQRVDAVERLAGTLAERGIAEAAEAMTQFKSELATVRDTLSQQVEAVNSRISKVFVSPPPSSIQVKKDGVKVGERRAINFTGSAVSVTDDRDGVHIAISGGGGGGSVDSVSNVAADRVLGRITPGSGESEELTAAQVRTLLNVEDGAAADMTAAEILTAIKTVDGAGSGLDADLLDGNSSAFFATAAALASAIAAAVNDGDTAGGVLSGTYPNPGFAVDMATQAELDAHVNDTTDAHDASAVSFSPSGDISSTDVQAAVLESLADARAYVDGRLLSALRFPALRLSAPLPTMLNNAWQFNVSAYAYNHSTVDQVIGVRRQWVFAIDQDRKERLFRRTINSDAQSVRPDSWTQLDLSTKFSATPVGKDSHHICAMALDGDGFVHLLTNMHADGLTGRYVWSTVARSVTLSEYAAGSMDGTKEAQMSYPIFVPRSDGKLLLFYRDGVPGNGDEIVKLYTHDGSAPDSANWSTLHNPLIDGKSESRSPYLWQPVIDPDTHDIFIFFCWRDGSSQNEKLACIKSTDDGATWVRPDGTAITLPITTADYTGAMIVDNLALTASVVFVNQGSACIDADGNPHVVYNKLAGGVSTPHHAYWNGSAWTVVRLPQIAEITQRPSIVSDDDGGVFVITQSAQRGRKGELRIMEVTPGVAQSLADASFLRFSMGDGSPLAMEAPRRLYGELHFMIGLTGTLNDDDTTSPDGDWINRTYMLSVEVDRLADICRGIVEVPAIETVASIPIPALGTEIVMSGSLGSIGAPRWRATDDYRDRQLFARFHGVCRADASTTLQVKIAETTVAGVTTLHGDHQITDTSDAAHEIPWVPLTALLTGGVDGEVTVQAGISSGSGNGYLRGTLEIGMLTATENYQ